MKLAGKVAYRDLEGGLWVLEAEDGRTYQLAGGDRRMKKDGAHIEAEGSIDEGAASLGMVGAVFQVSRYVLRGG